MLEIWICQKCLKLLPLSESSKLKEKKEKSYNTVAKIYGKNKSFIYEIEKEKKTHASFVFAS